jgi:hypothetical protein
VLQAPRAPLTKVAPEVQRWLQKKLSTFQFSRNSHRGHFFRFNSLAKRSLNLLPTES